MLHNRVSIREYLRGLRTIDDGGRHTLPLPESSPRAKRNARELVLYPCYTRVIYIYIELPLQRLSRLPSSNDFELAFALRPSF